MTTLTDGGTVESAAPRREAQERVLSDTPLELFEPLTRGLTGITTTEALNLIVDAAQHQVAGADLVSATLRTPDGTIVTPIGTHEIAADLGRAREREGLVPTAKRPQPSIIGSEDLRAETRWPQLAATARRHGFGAMLSTELFAVTGHTEMTGTLDLYSRRPHGLTSTDRDKALLLSTHGSLALTHAQVLEKAEEEISQLRQAIENRDVIGQAKGILMVRQGITADEAFEVLRAASQELNMKLVDIAQCLAGRHTDL